MAIKLYNKHLEEIKFELSQFPDKTSQVWKIEDLDAVHKVLWHYENEAEAMQLFQLLTLLRPGYHLYIPYLPYARQDKPVSNQSTFAKETFIKILATTFGVKYIRTVDQHSTKNYQDNGHQWGLNEYSSPPNSFFHKAIEENDLICYPDKGAKLRYGYNNKPVIYFDKVRDQSSGAIISNELAMGTLISVDALKDKKVLIIDDICDGGQTFINTAAELKKHGVAEVNLAVTHGIFSKGIYNLLENGITKIYTTNTYRRSAEVENQIGKEMDRVKVHNIHFITF